VTVQKNLCDPVTTKQKPLLPGDRIVTPVTALSIVHMGVTTPCSSLYHALIVLTIKPFSI